MRISYDMMDTHMHENNEKENKTCFGNNVV